MEVTFALIDVRAEPEVPARLVAALARLVEKRATFAVIDEGKRGLVYIDGRLVRELEPGIYGFWNAVRAAHRRGGDAAADRGSAGAGDPDPR